MAKKGFELNTLTKLISSDSDKPNWPLCVGAGISAPLFPDWYSLAQRLANTLIPSQELSENMIKQMGFSADALKLLAFSERICYTIPKEVRS